MPTPLTNPSQALEAITKLVRPNRFAVSINIGGQSLKVERIESVDFPAYSIETVDAKINNRPIAKIPISLQFQNTCNITFRLDSDGTIVKSLYELINKSFNFNQGELFVAYLEEISGTIEITGFKQDDTKIFTLSLSNAFLSSVEATQMSYDEQDSYMKQTAVFSYQYAEIES